MKRISAVLGVALVVAALITDAAWAARLGGGRSVGRQSSHVTQREAAPAPSAPQAAPGVPAQAQPQRAAPAQGPLAQPQAQPQRSRWLAPLAGLAAGLGLAALASHFGVGEQLASFMLVALLVFAALALVRFVMARRAPARPAYQASYGHTGVGAEATVGYPPPGSYPPAEASSRPAAAPPPAAPASSAWRVPADFDADGFVRNAKLQFARLQASFDTADLSALEEFTTPEMFAELKAQIAERRGAANRTDVVRLDAELLGIESGVREHVASVRFRGLLRESDGAPAEDFDEVWNLTKPVDGSGGWLLAGIQQLQ